MTRQFKEVIHNIKNSDIYENKNNWKIEDLINQIIWLLNY